MFTLKTSFSLAIFLLFHFKQKFQKMLDLLEDDDDVQEVYHNAEFPEGWEE